MVLPRTSARYNHSRLVLLIRVEVNFKLLENFMSEEEPSIWVRISIDRRKSICIGGSYREHQLLLQQQPNQTGTTALQQQRWESTIRGWAAAARGNRCFFIGDLNLDYSRWQQPEAGHTRMVDKIKTEIETLGFFQIIRGMTRFWPHQPPSQLDHCWTNAPGLVLSHSNETWSSSDHNLIGVMIRTRDRKESCNETKGRQWKKMNVDRFKQRIKDIVWTDFLENRNINELNEMFVNNVRRILDNEAPQIVRQHRRHYASWLDEDLKKMKDRRDELRNVAAATGQDGDWRDYRTLRNSYNKELSKAKTDLYRKRFEIFAKEKDVKKIYSEAKAILKWNTGGPPRSFLLNGRLWRKPADLARLQMDYFTNKVQGLMDRLNGQYGNPLDYLKVALERWDGREKVPKFNFMEVTMLETINFIRKLGNSTACGPDEIDATSIKLAVESLMIPIKHMINVSLTEVSFVNKWKIVRTIPLLKNKDLDKLNPKSYRPVALLSMVSKIVERAAQCQLLDFLETTGQLNANCHAYRKGLSTTSTLIQVMDGLYSATEDRKVSEIMALDQSCAFDCIKHELLLDKLKLYSIDTKAVSWIRNYLSHRLHFVNIGRADSGMQAVSRGVPQGSVLGPLLYSVYTNNITEAVRDRDCTDQAHQETGKLFGNDCETCGVLIIYADDSTYRISNRFSGGNQARLRDKLHCIRDYLNSNDLVINMDKTVLTECMIKQKRGRTPGIPPELEVENARGQMETVRDSMHCRVLGATIKNNMTWIGHLESADKAVLPEVRRNLGMLKSLGRKLPMNCRNTLARGMVISKMTYLISIWGGPQRTTGGEPRHS